VTTNATNIERFISSDKHVSAFIPHGRHDETHEVAIDWFEYFAEPGKMETLPYVTTFATIKDEPDLDDIQNTPSRNPGGDGV